MTRAYYGDDFTGSTDVMEALSKAGLVVNVTLSITLSGNQKIIRWPASATGYILEVNNTLSNVTSWAQAPGAPAIVGQFWQLTDSTAAGSRFYRLRK